MPLIVIASIHTQGQGLCVGCICDCQHLAQGCTKVTLRSSCGVDPTEVICSSAPKEHVAYVVRLRNLGDQWSKDRK